MRQSKIANYMEIAEACAKRSHDAQTQVGAVLVNNKSGAIMSTGYNGFVRGAPDDQLPTTRPEKYEFILHAELNLISNCAKHGISMEDTMMVCTLSPCKACTRMIFNCGITKVVTKTLYKDFDEILSLKDIKVACTKDDTGLYHISYEPKVEKAQVPR